MILINPGPAGYPCSNKLLIHQTLLGPDAKPDELNVVQVETISFHDAIKIPVAVLKAEETARASLIEFSDAPGTGSVHIIGHHLLGALIKKFEDINEMEEEILNKEDGNDLQFKDEDDEEEGESKGKKSKMSTSKRKNEKK